METELTLIQKEGQLKKLTGTFKKDWEPRWIVLTHQSIMSYKYGRVNSKPTQTIPRRNIHSVKLISSFPNQKNVIEIQSSKNTMILACESNTELNQWSSLLDNQFHQKKQENQQKEICTLYSTNFKEKDQEKKEQQFEGQVDERTKRDDRNPEEKTRIIDMKKHYSQFDSSEVEKIQVEKKWGASSIGGKRLAEKQKDSQITETNASSNPSRVQFQKESSIKDEEEQIRRLKKQLEEECKQYELDNNSQNAKILKLQTEMSELKKELGQIKSDDKNKNEIIDKMAQQISTNKFKEEQYIQLLKEKDSQIDRMTNVGQNLKKLNKFYWNLINQVQTKKIQVNHQTSQHFFQIFQDIEQERPLSKKCLENKNIKKGRILKNRRKIPQKFPQEKEQEKRYIVKILDNDYSIDNSSFMHASVAEKSIRRQSQSYESQTSNQPSYYFESSKQESWSILQQIRNLSNSYSFSDRQAQSKFMEKCEQLSMIIMKEQKRTKMIKRQIILKQKEKYSEEDSILKQLKSQREESKNIKREEDSSQFSKYYREFKKDYSIKSGERSLQFAKK